MTPEEERIVEDISVFCDALAKPLFVRRMALARMKGDNTTRAQFDAAQNRLLTASRQIQELIQGYGS